jgi:DNA-binding cell septation regulator SpoVG
VSENAKIEIHVDLAKGTDKTLFFADVTVLAQDLMIQVHGIGVRDGERGLFASLPQRKGSHDKWYDIVTFNRSLSEQIQFHVVAAASKALGRS